MKRFFRLKVLMICFIVLTLGYICYSIKLQDEDGLNMLTDLPNVTSLYQVSPKAVSNKIRSHTGIMPLGQLNMASEDVLLYEFTYISGNDIETMGQVVAPKDYLNQQYPVVIMLTDYFVRPNDTDIPASILYDLSLMASQGYIVLTCENILKEQLWQGNDNQLTMDQMELMRQRISGLISIGKSSVFTNENLYLYCRGINSVLGYQSLKVEDRIDGAIMIDGIMNLAKEGVANERKLIIGDETDAQSPINQYYSMEFWYKEIKTPLFLAYWMGADANTLDQIAEMKKESQNITYYDWIYNEDIEELSSCLPLEMFHWLDNQR